MALAVYTGQLGTYRGADGLDITLKSSHGLGRMFAPTAWDMVLGVKRGKVSEAQYREWYLDVLRASYRARQAAWQQLLRQSGSRCCVIAGPTSFVIGKFWSTY
jgi:hypothetical protein